MLTSDELGEKGESHFREICADAKLICNKSDRDRTGWDFIIEFPFKDEKNNSLDIRPIPPSCHIQVKTIYSSSKSIKLRLTAAERLAKELKPTFIYLSKVDKNLQFIESYLIHILDARLATILKRLRLEEKSGNKSKINQKYITLTPSKEEKINLQGEPLRNAIESVCSGMHKYIQIKEKQLESLGFEGYPIHGKMTLHTGEEDFVDVFLGLKKDIKVTNFETFQKRFGIELPLDICPEGKISIQPHASDECLINVRTDSLSPPAIFKGEVFLPGIPGLPDHLFKSHIKSSLFSILITATQFEFSFDWSSQKHSIKYWKDFWRLMKALSIGEGNIQIEFIKNQCEFNLKIPSSNTLYAPNLCENAINLCDDLMVIFTKAGVPTDFKLKMADIEEHILDIQKLKMILDGQVPTISVETKPINNIVISITEPFIFARLYQFGEIYIAIYGLAIFQTSADQVVWTSQDFSLKSIKRLSSKKRYDDFVNNAKSTEGLDNIISYAIDHSVVAEIN